MGWRGIYLWALTSDDGTCVLVFPDFSSLIYTLYTGNPISMLGRFFSYMKFFSNTKNRIIIILFIWNKTSFQRRDIAHRACYFYWMLSFAISRISGLRMESDYVYVIFLVAITLRWWTGWRIVSFWWVAAVGRTWRRAPPRVLRTRKMKLKFLKNDSKLHKYKQFDTCKVVDWCCLCYRQ